MIENQRGLDTISHTLLILGILTILFLPYVITFIFGWNQHLWPLLIINDASLSTAAAGKKSIISTCGSPARWNGGMATILLLRLIPPVVSVLVMQRASVRGLVER